MRDEPDYDESGVDLTLIRWFLDLSVEERPRATRSGSHAYTTRSSEKETAFIRIGGIAARIARKTA